MFEMELDGKKYFQFESLLNYADQIGHAICSRDIDISNLVFLKKICAAEPAADSAADSASKSKAEPKTKSNIKNKPGVPECNIAAPISFADQLHGKLAWFVSEKDLNPDHIALKGDILITKLSYVPLLIRIADCASIILFDPVKKVLVNLHAGWRGMAQKVIREAIDKISKRFGSKSKNLIACISPMLGPCCSRFTNPKKELPRHMHKFISEENTVDLWAAAENQLLECGVNKKNIENPRICTYCNPEFFYSYRREKDSAKRFAVVAWLKYL